MVSPIGNFKAPATVFSTRKRYIVHILFKITLTMLNRYLINVHEKIYQQKYIFWQISIRRNLKNLIFQLDHLRKSYFR
jgi:hypothetical protein